MDNWNDHIVSYEGVLDNFKQHLKKKFKDHFKTQIDKEINLFEGVLGSLQG